MTVIRVMFAFAAAALAANAAGPSGAEVAAAIRESALDAGECYRVRDVNFSKEDVRFYLTEGYLIFSKPVNGGRISAVFSADVEGGDAEVILMPPHRNERRSLAEFTESPNLDEHFNSALFILPANLSEELQAKARERGRKSPEMGASMAGQLTSVVRNITSGFGARLVEDVLSPDREDGLFFAAVGGRKLGNFDILVDPYSREQILVGQYRSAGGRMAFDTWTSFESRSVARGQRQRPELQYELTNYQIDATIRDDLRLSAVTKATLTTKSPGWRAFVMLVADNMRIGEVKIDGAPAEVLARDSMRENAMHFGSANEVFLVVTPEPLASGIPHSIEIRHDGDVVRPAGNNVYFVSSRGNWYPRCGSGFTTYDLTFRYPSQLTLVANGDLIEERAEAGMKIMRRRIDAPVRVAGFNLGVYDHTRVKKDSYEIAVYGNKAVEPVLQPKQPPIIFPPAPIRGRRGPEIITLEPPPITSPASHMESLANEVAAAFSSLAAQLGPPPLRTLTVAPIPTTFGQGFPGLVYLPTVAYLRPEERPLRFRARATQIFFSDLLPGHEVAHQWWGNLVLPAGYQDEWIMEALANYSALQLLEKRKGARALQEALDFFQQDLLAKTAEGKTVESLGPIIWGMRLLSSRSDDAWRVIVYEKGAWIMHMLRRRMGDERFSKMLAEAARRFRYKEMSTEDFRRLAQEFMPPRSGSDALEAFFESWVYDTGIPTLSLSATVKGKAPSVRLSITVKQSDVGPDFSVDAPVLIQFAKGAPIVKWIRTSSDAVTTVMALKQAPARVSIPPDLLAIRK
jgi:hypothetical protein